MKRSITLIAMAALVGLLCMSQPGKRDWAGLTRFAQANTELLALAGTKVKVVFMGNSITEGWMEQHPQFFTENGFVARGISGQTSAQMLVRFRQDVINLHPKVVVILAGTNDVAENTGPYSLEHTMGNIVSMCELAKANDIKVVLCTLTPANRFPWNPGITDATAKIETLNARITAYAKQNKLQLVDYYTPLVTGRERAFDPGKSSDGVHPTLAGYAVMEPLVLKAIRKHVKK